jgi:hypothetical protein
MPFRISSISSSSELSEKSATAGHGIPGGEVLKREIGSYQMYKLEENLYKKL